MRQTQDQKRFSILEMAAELAWANDTTAQYAIIRCPPTRTIGPTVCS